MIPFTTFEGLGRPASTCLENSVQVDENGKPLYVPDEKDLKPLNQEDTTPRDWESEFERYMEQDYVKQLADELYYHEQLKQALKKSKNVRGHRRRVNFLVEQCGKHVLVCLGNPENHEYSNWVELEQAHLDGYHEPVLKFFKGYVASLKEQLIR